jgi:hypothetical protein
MDLSLILLLLFFLCGFLVCCLVVLVCFVYNIKIDMKKLLKCVDGLCCGNKDKYQSNIGNNVAISGSEINKLRDFFVTKVSNNE